MAYFDLYNETIAILLEYTCPKCRSFNRIFTDDIPMKVDFSFSCHNCGNEYSFIIQLEKSYRRLYVNNFDNPKEISMRQYFDEYIKIKQSIFYRALMVAMDTYRMPFDRFNKSKKTGKIDIDSPRSSQAIALSVWGCIFLSPLNNKIFNRIFDENETDWDIRFEYIDDNDYLNEGKKQYRTHIDILLCTKNTARVIESKFMEENDRCSFYDKENEEQACSGTNPIKYGYDDIKCKCHQKGRKYWEYIPELYDFSSRNPNNLYCPFRDQYRYQMMRNLCFGHMLEEYYSINNVKNYLAYVELPRLYKERPEYNTVYKRMKKGVPDIDKEFDDVPFEEYLKKYLKKKDRLSIISYSEIISIAKSVIAEKDAGEIKVFNELENWMENKVDVGTNYIMEREYR